MSEEQKKEATDMNQTLPVCICGATRVSDTFCDECGLPPRVGEQQTAPASPIPTEREDCEGARACPTWKDANSSDELEAFYKSVIPGIRDAAMDCGYAIGVHGSMRRDLDLIAVPWSEEHSSKECLAEVVQLAACGFRQETYVWEQKPSGRVAATFPICWNESGRPSAGHVDLSVMLDARAADDEGKDELAKVREDATYYKLALDNSEARNKELQGHLERQPDSERIAELEQRLCRQAEWIDEALAEINVSEGG